MQEEETKKCDVCDVELTDDNKCVCQDEKCQEHCECDEGCQCDCKTKKEE